MIKILIFYDPYIFERDRLSFVKQTNLTTTSCLHRATKDKRTPSGTEWNTGQKCSWAVGERGAGLQLQYNGFRIWWVHWNIFAVKLLFQLHLPIKLIWVWPFWFIENFQHFSILHSPSACFSQLCTDWWSYFVGGDGLMDHLCSEALKAVDKAF